MRDRTPQAKGEDRDPSMEEILSSIRRIIASDQEQETPPKPAAAQGNQPGEAAEDVVELTEVVPESEGEGAQPLPRAAPAERPALAALEQQARAELEATAKRLEAVEEQPKASIAGADAHESLVSNAAASAATAAFAKLTRSLSRPQPAFEPIEGGKSVEAFLADLLRPMLKEWLDRNLPALVERVVEQEVKKLARRAELL